MAIERIIIGSASSANAFTTSWATFTNNESWELNLANAKQIAYDGWNAASFGGYGFAIVGDNLGTSTASNLATTMVQDNSGSGSTSYHAYATYPGSPHTTGGHTSGVPTSTDGWGDYYDTTNNVWILMGHLQNITDPSASSSSGSSETSETSNFAVEHTQAYGSNSDTVIDHEFSTSNSVNATTVTTPFNRLKTKVDAQSTYDLDDLLMEYLLIKDTQPFNKEKFYDFIAKKV